MANNKFVVKNGLQTQNVDFVSPDQLNKISIDMLNTDTLSVSGNSGQLFSITDSMTGVIYAVNDISGVPSIEVYDSGQIRFAELFGNVLIGTSTDNGTDKLQVNGSLLATTLKGNLDWSYIQNKPDPVITLAGDLTGSVTLTDLGNGTLTATIAANSVALGTDTTGNYMVDVSAGTGISISHTPGEGSTATITNSAPNVTTDISITHNASTVVVNSSDGTDGTINAATQSLAGVMSSTDKTKLDGIASGATANTGTVTSIATSSPLTGGTITTSGTIGIQVANSTQSGYLSSTDWNTFNNKQPAGSYLTSESDTLATVTSRGNTTTQNIGAIGTSLLNLVTSGNAGTWIGGIQDATSGWSLNKACIGLKADDTSYAAIGIAPSNGILYFARTTNAAGTLNSFIEVDNTRSVKFLQTANITTAGFAGVEYWNNSTWQVYIGTENNTSGARYNSRTGVHTWYNNGTQTAQLSGNNLTIVGSLSAATKSFLIPHPTKPNKKLRYGSLEGPENGVYVRGKLDGDNVIELPEYWTKLVDPDSITVNLTPIGKAQNLYVKDIRDNKVYVSGRSPRCFFTVYGERVDVEKLQVEID